MNDFINCDCLDGMKQIPDKSIDMILCDPPYGTTRNEWDSVIPLDLLWEQWKRIIKDGGVVAVFSQMPFTVDVVQSNRKWFRYEWIWEKPLASGFLNANRMPLKAHENILIFYETLPTFNPQFTHGCKDHRVSNHAPSTNYGKYKQIVTISDGRRYPKDVFTVSNTNRMTHINPTQKPTRLMEYLILTYTNKGETVLDPCAGSGSSLIAAYNMGRNFIGFERDSEMYEKAKKRVDSETAQMNIFSL